MRKILLAAGVAAFIVSGCSSKPREFKPQLGVTTIDQARFVGGMIGMAKLKRHNKESQSRRS